MDKEQREIIEKALKELSEEELKLLNYFNEGENRNTIKAKYGITLYFNDDRVMKLLDIFEVYDRIDLVMKYREYLKECENEGKTDSDR